MAEGFFRSKKGFTVVQNEITKDANISLKAKGLYLVIQAYISMPDRKWTKEDFRNLTKEGKKAFDSAWKELKESGYLKVNIMCHFIMGQMFADHFDIIGFILADSDV